MAGRHRCFHGNIARKRTPSIGLYWIFHYSIIHESVQDPFLSVLDLSTLCQSATMAVEMQWCPMTVAEMSSYTLMQVIHFGNILNISSSCNTSVYYYMLNSNFLHQTVYFTSFSRV